MNDATQLVSAVDLWAHAGAVVLGTTPQQKKPNGLWRAITAGTVEPPTLTAVKREIETGAADGICVLTGAISQHLEMIETEGAAASLLDTFYDGIESAGLSGLWNRIANGCVEKSPKGGVHYFFRTTAAEKSQKLAHIEGNAPDDWPIGIETRGAGGLVVVAPSPGGRKGSEVQPNKPYAFIPDTAGPSGIPTITIAERFKLYEVCRACCQKPKAQKNARYRKQVFSDDTPEGKFNNAVSFHAVLTAAGWTKGMVSTSADFGTTTEYARPGGNLSSARSGVINQLPGQSWLYIFSSSVEASGHHSTPFSIWAALNFKTDKEASERVCACLSEGMTWKDIVNGQEPKTKVTWNEGGGVTVKFT